MASTIARSIRAVRSTGAIASLLLPKRLLSSTVSNPPPLPGFARLRLSAARFATPALSHSLRIIHPTRVNSVRCRGITRRPNPPALPVATYVDGHWFIKMDKPCGEGATKQQMIDCYIQTLAKVLGSEEDAKKKIYNVCFEKGWFGFGCEIDDETSDKLKGVLGVQFVIPDSYVDAENKDFGDELLVNGKIVQRSPERQRRIEPPARETRYKRRVDAFPFVY